ncbi:S-layer homology domain-containing protein [Cohnella soli]|uniref:S-layer homology domain-containing protein n=1 Tax=Cohnella soli TaxID=425005 RepID=A0ABW0HNY8_9BACL
MKKMMISVVASALVFSSFGGSASAAQQAKFKDVPASHWAYSAIMQASTKGYVKGFPDGTFHPDAPVTVAQFISMMMLSMSGKDESGAVTWSKATLDRIDDATRHMLVDGFVFDFSQGKPWYKNYVESLQTLGFIKNEYVGRYDESLTRERAARIVSATDILFHSLPQDEYAYLAVKQMKDQKSMEESFKAAIGATLITGVLSGFPDGSFKPKKVLSRSEAISVIERVNNDALRKPAKVNLSGVPYSMVPIFGYKDLSVNIFDNNEMKLVHDQLAKTIPDYEGVVEHNGNQFFYFLDEATREKYDRAYHYLEDFFNYDTPVDVSLGISNRTYTIIFTKYPERYERAKTVLSTVLTTVFKEKAADVQKIFDTAVKDFQNGKSVKIKQMVGKRQIIIEPSGDGYTLHTAISAYADK